MSESTYDKSVSVSDDIQALTKEIIDALTEVYPRDYEEVAKAALTTGDLTRVPPEIQKKLIRLRKLEEQEETPMMRMVRLSQENLNRRPDDAGEFLKGIKKEEN